VKNEKIGNFYFVGHYLCLDFINTLAADAGQPVELLATFGDLIAWAAAAKLVEAASTVQRLQAWGDPSSTAAVLQQALALRTTLYQMITAMMAGQGVPIDALDAINHWLQLQRGYTAVVQVDDRFEKRYHSTITEPLQLLAPIAQSASDLLCYGDRKLLKKCENPTCVLYFYDTTKNHTRRWCSMTTCGNRAKAAAHYRRLRARG